MSGDPVRRCGFVAVLGAPNAGKSTLTNTLVGSKVSIVSPKIQTTRSLVRGIVIKDGSQIIIVDTPGIFAPGKRLERAMVGAAWQGSDEADAVMVLLDVAHTAGAEGTRTIIGHLRQTAGGRPVALVLNKIDLIKRPLLLEIAKNLNEQYPFAATFMISALKANGTDDLLAWLAKTVPEGPWHFEEDQISDMPARLLAAEITREKLFHRLYQELPYALTVETESWEPFENGSVKISQVIYVMRESHRAIVLGKGGSQIGRIGQEAREELEELFEQRVHLKLFVKVRENWQDDPERYAAWGLSFEK